MSTPKVNLNLLKQINSELNETILDNHISQISVINSTDILMQLSFNNKEKLFISLNHTSPFISLVPFSTSFPTVKGGLSEALRSLIKTSYIKEVNLIHNDRIMEFTLVKTNEFFEKATMYLILELIPTKANLLILQGNREIIYAYHYQDITKPRPVIKGMLYKPYPPKDLLEEEVLNLQSFKEEVVKYINIAEEKRKKEALKPLYTHLSGRKKSLMRKIGVLNKEIRTAESKFIYKDYGEMIFALMYDQGELDKYIKENLTDTYDDRLDYVGNANKYFKIYKKSKKTIEMNAVEIEKAERSLQEVENTLNVFYFLDEDEIKELYEKYLPNKAKGMKKSRVDARLPYYVTVNGTTIGYGKNSKQNDYLSFKKAKKSDIFLHIKDFHGCHVIVFNDNPSNDVLLTASEICLILSNKKEGNVQYTKVSNIKKGHHQGEALLDNYQEFTLRSVREETYNLIKGGKRFSD